MITFRQAMERVRKMPAFRTLKESDLRAVAYCQEFNSVGSATTTSGIQTFPNGFILLGITANAHVPGAAAAAGQSANNRQIFGLTFSLTGAGEALTPPGAHISAEALLGGGPDTIFPAKEMVLASNVGITAGVENFTTTTINIQIVYHGLLFRYQA